MAKNWKQYWEERGAEVNRRRRQRYENDGAYRQRVLEGNRVSKEKKAAKRHGDRSYEGSPKTKPLVVEVGDRKLVCLPIAKVAAEINRHPQTIRGWIRKGIIPPPFTGRDGRRWFSEVYTHFLRQMVREHRYTAGGWRTGQFRVRVWKEFGQDPSIPEHSLRG